MKGLLPPLCLVLCLAMLITAFALLATDAPEEGIELHRARFLRDDGQTDLLEKDLKRRIWLRRVLIGSLFVAAVGFGAGAFLVGSRR